ncbi:hypothetical protein Bra3105_05470 [Brachybacterium halotolerans subsp. kimchii]|uniref:hypothetical protein n=1 Tax=Brachybacterium halotolerans TaxID=2795215 RepID=UPI001E29F3A4|nr:hypothetical protein [Brachybacterium halotolerans]UEJ83767.1 hypothetical protein Bra3105_05470 [Brachybacterium halotolerans subsp. kimchii]
MDQGRMRTIPSHALSSSDAPASRGAGRPAVFTAIVMIALAVLMTVLLGGPTMPLATSIAMASVSVLLVAIGWVVAGPRRP